MTITEKYEVLLGELAEKLKEKNDTISLQNWQIADLKNKLQEAELSMKAKYDKVVSLEVRKGEKHESKRD